MKCKIVYLESRNGYRAALRSDTIWGAICWAIALLYPPEDQRVEESVLYKILHGADPEAYPPFYVSSAFPFQIENGKYIPFLPQPQVVHQSQLLPAETPFDQVKEQLRKWKKEGKGGLVKKKDYVEKYVRGLEIDPESGVPQVKVEATPHNTIDRLIGSTLTINKRGQLFHMEDRFVLPAKGVERAGLYFLLQGYSPAVEAALRFLQHFGIGGDRSIGKGIFTITVDDFEIEEPANANAVTTLSLYHPTAAELAHFQGTPAAVLQYRTEVRKGWKTLQAKGSQKQATLHFTEGSVFPLFVPGKQIYGQNRIVGEHENGHEIHQYGHGFMLKIKVDSHAN